MKALAGGSPSDPAIEEEMAVLAVNVNDLELTEETSELNPQDSLRFAFPLSSADGTASTAAVYFELDPGKRLARHTDSAEEVLVVLEGRAEATIGAEHRIVEAGGMVVVPAMQPHDVTNVGDGLLRVVGVFSSSTVVATFEQAAVEGGERVFVIGAPVALASPL